MATADGSHVPGASWRRDVRFQHLQDRPVPTGSWPLGSHPGDLPPPLGGGARSVVWPLIGVAATLVLATTAILFAAHLPPRITAAAAALVLVLGTASTAALVRRRNTAPPLGQALGSPQSCPPAPPPARCTRRCPTPSGPELLNDLVTACGSARSTDELLDRCLPPLMQVAGARGGWVRLLDDNGGLRLSASWGIDPEFTRAARLCHECTGACWAAFGTGEMHGRAGFESCIERTGRPPLPKPRDHTLMAIPIVDDHGEALGIYGLILSRDRVPCAETLSDLLNRAGRHIGLAIRRLRDDRKARWLSINEERRLLAHELHDSVAQTLSALRMRIRQMEAAAGLPTEKSRLPAHMRRLRRDLDRSYRELRTLMGQFRGMVDGEGLHSALERLVLHVQRESDIEVRLINDWEPDCLNGEQELQVLRIVQEALCNIRQHSGAAHARVLLREHDHVLEILVEDDGCGFEIPLQGDHNNESGYHIGLSGLETRTQRLGGVMTVESEPGEGTCVRVRFPRPSAEGTVPGHQP